MSWQYQQSGRQWPARAGADGGEAAGGSNAGPLGKLTMSLDAVCYLVAFFLVDLFTFGRPPTVYSTPTLEKQESPMDSFVGHTARSASEGDTLHAQTPLERIPRRSSNHSEGSASSRSLHRFESFSSERKSPRADYKDGALHHNQKAIFERQVSTPQPFIY